MVSSPNSSTNFAFSSYLSGTSAGGKLGAEGVEEPRKMARWRPPIASIAAAVLLVQTLGPTAAHGVAHGGFGTDSGGPTDDDGGGGEDKPVVTNVDKPGELVDSQAFRPMFSMKCSRSKRQVKGSR